MQHRSRLAVLLVVVIAPLLWTTGSAQVADTATRDWYQRYDLWMVNLMSFSLVLELGASVSDGVIEFDSFSDEEASMYMDLAARGEALLSSGRDLRIQLQEDAQSRRDLDLEQTLKAAMATIWLSSTLFYEVTQVGVVSMREFTRIHREIDLYRQVAELWFQLSTLR